MVGTLHLCATSIDNLENITFRVSGILKKVDLITAEDTRYNIKLLSHFDMKTPAASYHEYNEMDKTRHLVGQLEEEVDVVLIMDVGTPGMSDPGEEPVRQCYEAGIQVTSLPDPAACITVLTMSGLSTRGFCFETFLLSEEGGKKERARILEKLRQETGAIIIYETSHHLVRTLEDLYKVLGDRNITIRRKLTKRYETVYRTTSRDALEHYHEEESKEECVIIIGGKPLEKLRREQISRQEEVKVREHLVFYTDQGMDRKEAMKAMARNRGIIKQDMYQQLLRWGRRQYGMRMI